MEIEVHNGLNNSVLSEWRRFLGEARHQHPRQDPRFAVVEQANGNTPLYVLGRQNKEICALGIFLLRPSRVMQGRYSIATALSGPVCDDTRTMISFLSALSKHPAFAKVGALSITPYWLGDDAVELSSTLAQAGWRVSEAEVSRHTGLIDLTLPEAELRASFSRSARRKVRLVEQSEIQIRLIDTLDDAFIFFEHLNKLVLSRHNLPMVSLSEQRAGFEAIYSDATIGAIFAAYHDDQFLGGLLLHRSNRTAHAARYVANPESTKAVGNLRVAPSLWLEGLLWAKRAGCTHFDVEGFLPVEDKSHPKFNVYEYKREFKPTYVKRVAEHILPLNRFVHTVEQGPRRVRQIAKRVMTLGKR